MRRSVGYVVVSAVAVGLGGCGGDATLGRGEQAQGEATLLPRPVDEELLRAGTVPQGCEGRQEPFEPVVTYRGYIDRYFAGEGISGVMGPESEQVTLKLSQLDSDSVAGRIFHSEGPGNYGNPDNAEGCGGMNMIFDADVGAQGFGYTLHSGSVEGRRVSFAVTYGERLCAWCGQQPVYPDPNGNYACVPFSTDGNFDADSGIAYLHTGVGEWQAWACLPASACMMVCRCTEGGCGVPLLPETPPTGPDYDTGFYDLVLEGDALTGTSSYGDVFLTHAD